jgi:hypothetical protein
VTRSVPDRTRTSTEAPSTSSAPSSGEPHGASTASRGPGAATDVESEGDRPAPGSDPGATSASSPVTIPRGASGPGFTAKEIRIGVGYDSTFSEQLGAAGATGATPGDQRRQVLAITDDINERGGIAGRRVVPVFYDTRGRNSQNEPAALAQGACAAWTEDTLVFAAMTYVVQMDNEVLYSCLAKHKVLFVPLAGESRGIFSRYAPYIWTPAGVAVERIPPTWIARLTALGYFRGWDTSTGSPGNAPVKIGLLYGNGVRNNQRQLDQAFVASTTKALAGVNRTVAASFEVTNDPADVTAAVLRFKSAKVTHVLGDYSLVNFTPAAESQRYRPRYGFTSFSPGIAFNLFAPPEQLRGALGVGWIPSSDVEGEQDPGDVSPAEAHCRKVMSDADQTESSGLAKLAMTWGCDTFTFLDLAATKYGPSPDGVRAAAAAMGSMASAATFSIKFPGGRPDGVAAVRDIGRRDDCRCFAYLNTTNRPV